VRIIQIDPRTESLWERLLDRVGGSIFHSPEWIKVLTETYGFEAEAYVVLDEYNEPIAGVPFCRIVDFLGHRLVALPFSDYCDPLVKEKHVWNSIVVKLSEAGWPVVVRCQHNSLPLSDERFTVVKRAKWHGIDLRPNIDALWNHMHDSARRAVRKARQEGVTVEISRSAEALRQFFEMHLKVRKYKYQLLAQPYKFFENISRYFFQRDKGFLLLANHNNKIVAGVLFLGWKDTIYYKYNASYSEFLPLRPNNLLVWEGIAHAKAQGCTRWDFGLSDCDQEGLLRFKRHFGAEERDLYFLRYMPDPSFNVADESIRNLLTNLTFLLTDPLVPDRITEAGGELLYRFFA